MSTRLGDYIQEVRERYDDNERTHLDAEMRAHLELVRNPEPLQAVTA
jgi:hypothetical protein